MDAFPSLQKVDALNQTWGARKLKLAGARKSTLSFLCSALGCVPAVRTEFFYGTASLSR